MRRRTVFVFRRAVIDYYPVDGTPSEAVHDKLREGPEGAEAADG